MSFINNFINAQSAQSWTILGVAVFLSTISIVFGNIVSKADPMQKPTKFLTGLEIYYTGIENLFNSIFHGKVKQLMPYIGMLIIYILTMNYLPLFLPLEPPTTDYNIPLGLVIITVLIIHGVNIKCNGLKEFFAEFLSPMPFMLPLNLLELVSRPLSMSMRLFCNILSGTLILQILGTFTSWLQHQLIPFGPINSSGGSYLDVLGAIISIPFHGFFDIFAGTIQAFVFTLLTIIFVSLSVDFDEEPEGGK
jgi:F-type H+-transporting ATPase subunit a